MAAKKKAKRKTDPKKKEREKKAKDHCSKNGDWDTGDLCLYVKELQLWAEALVADYDKLRKAVCNLEAEVFDDGEGLQSKRYCKGGPGGDTAPPPTPPKWE